MQRVSIHAHEISIHHLMTQFSHAVTNLHAFLLSLELLCGLPTMGMIIPSKQITEKNGIRS